MSEVNKPYNSYQESFYRLAYSTSPRKRIKASHYVCMYGDKVLTNGKSYPQCVEDRKIFLQMGVQFPNKELLTIKPYKK